MITEYEYQDARRAKEAADAVIQAYFQQKTEAADARISRGDPFTDEELLYSAHALCPCGHGMAYPRECGTHRYWDCSAILKGVADSAVKHSDRLPFALYEIKSESESRGTTRGVFRPKPPTQEVV